MKCIVCFEEKKKIVTCPSCLSIACTECQEQYKIPACMNCATKFTDQFFKASGNDKLVKSILRPLEENLFWEREKTLLSSTQVLVDWEIELEQLYKQVRFGYHVKFPPKPFLSISSTGSIMFPCPSVECRGFVMPKDGKCGSCKKEVCLRCREPMSVNHTCKQETLDTLESLKKDSKACPVCSVRIFRTEGCNHMFCTYCRSHFDWVSMKVLGNSTNHHYDKTPTYSKFVKGNQTTSCDENIFSNAIAMGSLTKSFLDTDLCRWLWKESRIVREFVQTKLNREKLLEEHDQALIKVRMQFLRKVLSEDAAKKKVYLLEKNYELKLHETNLLEDFLRFIYQLQETIFYEKISRPDAEAQLQEAVQFFTKCLLELGSKVKLRADDGPLLLQ